MRLIFLCSKVCFLAVDNEYRRQHIVEKIMSYMLTFLDSKKDVVVTTYCEGVPEGISARAFYKHLGFVEGKLTEEFGGPVQEFILKFESIRKSLIVTRLFFTELLKYYLKINVFLKYPQMQSSYIPYYSTGCLCPEKMDE